MRNNPAVEKIDENKEISFIRDCLRAYLYQDHAFLPTFTDLDWDKFYQLLIQHRLVGLFSVLSRSYPGLWQNEIKERLREDRYRQLPYNDWRLRQVESILSALHKLNIPIIVLKGWALVQIVYGGDYSQRPSSDIDLLVRPCDITQVTEVLYSLNYRDFDLEPWPGYFRRFMNSCHYQSSQTYAGSGLRFSIDLHWGIPDAPYYDRRIAVEPLFARSGLINIADVEVNSLSTEDYLIYASVHMAHHGYSEIFSRYYEIAALILRSGQALNWKFVLTTASTWRVTIPLQRMLTDIDRLWPGIIPANAHEAAQQLKPSWGERFIDWCLTNSTRKEAIIIILSCLNTPGLFWRLRFFLETAFPGSAYLRHYFGPAPGNIWPLLYVLRFRRFLQG